VTLNLIKNTINVGLREGDYDVQEIGGPMPSNNLFNVCFLVFSRSPCYKTVRLPPTILFDIYSAK